MNEINLIHRHNSRYNNRENEVKMSTGMLFKCVIRLTIVNNSHYFLFREKKDNRQLLKAFNFP